MFNGLNVSCSVQGNRDEREAVDVSLVKQDAQVSRFGVVTFMKLGSLIVFLFFFNFCVCLGDRNCMVLGKTKWELTSLSLMPSCVLAVSLTFVQVCNPNIVCTTKFVFFLHPPEFTRRLRILTCDSFLYQSSRSTRTCVGETLKRVSAGKCLVIWSLAWWLWVRFNYLFIYFLNQTEVAFLKKHVEALSILKSLLKDVCF